MTKQVTYDVDRQIDALTTLRKRSGRGRSEIAVDLGIETDTYRRYENGQTELRVSQVEPFAAAYSVTPTMLLWELGFRLSARCVLAESGIVPADRIAILEGDLAGKPDEEQRSIVRQEIDGWRRKIARESAPAQRTINEDEEQRREATG